VNRLPLELENREGIYKLAQKAVESVPDEFQSYLKFIDIKVENFADLETLESLDLDNKYDLLGLYRGVPVPIQNRDKELYIDQQNIIYLYRGPIIKFSKDNNEELEELIHYVVIHELGHHFGFDDPHLDWAKD
jgi:predicted Zn-dependent protease with MMP-like domain